MAAINRVKTLLSVLLVLISISTYAQPPVQRQRYTTNLDNAAISGANLTTLNAANLSSGTIPFDRAGSLTNHSDVAITSLTTGNVLGWDASQNKWTNGVPGGGGSIAGTNVNVGVLNTETNSGVVPVLWAPVTSASSAGTSNGYVFRVGGTSSAVSSNLMYWTGISDGAGASTNPSVAIPNGVQFSPRGNTNYTAYAAGTVYSFTASQALIDFGTTDGTVTLSQSGEYLLLANVGARYNGATFAANQELVVKLRKTSGSAADIASAIRTNQLNIVTTMTGGVGILPVPPTIYIATAGDVVSVFGALSATPAVGSVDAVSAEIVAIRLK